MRKNNINFDVNTSFHQVNMHDAIRQRFLFSDLKEIMHTFGLFHGVLTIIHDILNHVCCQIYAFLLHFRKSATVPLTPETGVIILVLQCLSSPSLIFFHVLAF